MGAKHSKQSIQSNQPSKSTSVDMSKTASWSGLSHSLGELMDTMSIIPSMTFLPIDVLRMIASYAHHLHVPHQLILLGRDRDTGQTKLYSLPLFDDSNPSSSAAAPVTTPQNSTSSSISINCKELTTCPAATYMFRISPYDDVLCLVRRRGDEDNEHHLHRYRVGTGLLCRHVDTIEWPIAPSSRISSIYVSDRLVAWSHPHYLTTREPLHLWPFDHPQDDSNDGKNHSNQRPMARSFFWPVSTCIDGTNTDSDNSLKALMSVHVVASNGDVYLWDRQRGTGQCLEPSTGQWRILKSKWPPVHDPHLIATPTGIVVLAKAAQVYYYDIATDSWRELWWQIHRNMSAHAVVIVPANHTLLSPYTCIVIGFGRDVKKMCQWTLTFDDANHMIESSSNHRYDTNPTSTIMVTKPCNPTLLTLRSTKKERAPQSWILQRTLPHLFIHSIVPF
jgi:hypothetical protein